MRRKTVTQSTRTHLEAAPSTSKGLVEAYKNDKQRLVLEFMLRALRSFEPGDERESQFLISPHLPEILRRVREAEEANAEESARRRAANLPPMDLYDDEDGEPLPQPLPGECEAAAAVDRVDSLVATQWERSLKLGAFDDRIIAAMRSEHDEHEYLAVGRKRLYWYNVHGEAGIFSRVMAPEDEYLHAETSRHGGCCACCTGCFRCGCCRGKKGDGDESADIEEGRRAAAAASKQRVRERAVSVSPSNNELVGTLSYLPYEPPPLEESETFDMRAESGGGGGGGGGESSGRGGSGGEGDGAHRIRSLADCTFDLSRQGFLLAVPLRGSVLGVITLPIRFRPDAQYASTGGEAEEAMVIFEEGGGGGGGGGDGGGADASGSGGGGGAKDSIEGARVCYLLNELHVLVGNADGHEYHSDVAVTPKGSGGESGVQGDAVHWEGLSQLAIRPSALRAHTAEAQRRHHDMLLLDAQGDLLPLQTSLNETHIGAACASYLVR